MTRTAPLTLLAVGVLSAAAAWLAEIVLITMGQPSVVPPYSLAITLAIIAVVVLAMARPVRRAVRDRTHIDPFYATRVVILAKAASILGTIASGAAVGLLVFLLSRPVVPGVGSILLAGVALLGGIALLVAALVAENWCSVPPDDRDTPNDPATVRPQ